VIFARRLVWLPAFLFAFSLIFLSFAEGEEGKGQKEVADEVIDVKWKEVKEEHFIVYYSGRKKFAEEVSRRAEFFYDKIANDLGYDRHSNFWQWDNRVKIYLFATREEFVLQTALPWALADGVTKSQERTIIGYGEEKEFLKCTLPHELTHLIFRESVGYYESGAKDIPLWLEEGIAQWEEETPKSTDKELMKRFIGKQSYIPIRTLSRIRVSSSMDPVVARVFYAEAVTLVGYLMEKYGGKKFTRLCRKLRAGTPFDEALSSVYGSRVANASVLQKEWMEYCEK